MKKTIFYLLGIFSLLGFIANSYAIHQTHSFDTFVYQAMKKYHVPAVSLAIIDKGKIVYAHAYSIDPTLKVTTNSLFQAASISKSVAAYGALLLVDQSKINIDGNINTMLKSWKIPDSSYTTQTRVTLRNILDMTSGLSVPGFFGHSSQDPLPTLKQILNGEPPAENKVVRVISKPGSKYYYSGGSYQVMEQLIEDVTNTSFSKFMHDNVFIPLDMTHSCYCTILSKTFSVDAMPGFLKDGAMIPGKWKIIPALAAGGMWSTPTDLAKFTINVMHSFHAQNGLISKESAREMLTRQKNTDFGLGFVIDGQGKNLNFRKEGHNIGFYNWLIAFPNTQQGAIIMTNSENGVPLIKDILQEAARVYQWPDHYPIVDESERIQVTKH